MLFEDLEKLMTTGVDISLVIRKRDDGLTVAVLPKANGLKDEAQHQLTPLTLSGTARELDEGFLQAISAPMQKATGLLLNMKQFEQAADATKAASRAEKEKTDAANKEAREKKAKYDGFIKKADEQEKDGNYPAAIINYQQARLHATEAEKKIVDAKMAAARSKMGQGNLFDMAPATEQVSQTSSQTGAAAASDTGDDPDDRSEGREDDYRDDGTEGDGTEDDGSDDGDAENLGCLSDEDCPLLPNGEDNPMYLEKHSEVA